MKNILMLFSMSFEPYQGRYLRAYNEARTLIESGHQVTVLGWDRSGKSKLCEVRDGINIERIHVEAPDSSSIHSLPNFMRFSFKALSHVRSRRFDLIHCHNLQLLPLGILLKKFKRVPLIFDSCEPDYFALYPPNLHGTAKSLEILLAKQADAVFVHNDYQVKKYRKIGHPLVALIGSYPTKKMILEKPQMPQKKEKMIIGRIGSIYQNNGIEEILAGFRLISKRMENVELFFAGRVFNAYQNQFKQLTNGMEDKIKVFGAFNSGDMPKLYSLIDISIIVYRRSQWFKNITPTKFFDSLAMGVPVIVSDMGGLKDIVENYRCGIVVDERNPEMIAEAIQKMADDPFLRHEMAINGLRAVRNNYNWDKMRQKFLAIYGTLIS